MTVRKSIFISIFFHLLVLGSVLALAQFTKGAYLPGRDALTVSFVLSNSNAAKGNIALSNPQRSTLKQSAALPQQTFPEMPKDQSKEPSDRFPERAESDYSGGGVSSSRSSAGQDAQGVQGVISHEEWAVLETAIDRSKSYPRLARERGIEGTVRLRFKLAVSGIVDAIEIVESSGYEILDSASIRAVHRAEPLPYVKGWVELPIAYVLK